MESTAAATTQDIKMSEDASLDVNVTKAELNTENTASLETKATSQ